MSTIDIARELTRSEIEEIDDRALLSNAHRELFMVIRNMKMEKVNAYHAAKRAGDIDAETCDAIVSVLKTDIAVCDMLIVTDFEDEADVRGSIDQIRGIITSSPQPSHQDDYVRGLDENEVSMEVTYMKTVKELQDRVRAEV